MMDEDRFWDLVAESREAAARPGRTPHVDFIRPHMEELAGALDRLSPAEIVAFRDRFDDLCRRAYRWDVGGAAYWLGGGCSDDGFIDFRACLVSLGKELYYKVLQDPDSLAEIVDRPDVPYMQCEGFQYVASKVYRAKVDADMPASEGRAPAEPQGLPFDFDDEAVMGGRYPKLVAKVPEMGD